MADEKAGLKPVFPPGRNGVPELMEVIGQLDWKQGKPTVIYLSARYTLEQARDELSPTDILHHYYELTKDDRANINLDAALHAVLYHIQVQWFVVSGKPVPAQVTARYEQALGEAKVARKTEAAAEGGTATGSKPKKGLSNRVTIKTIAENAIRQGKSVDDTIAEVKAAYPNSKFNAKHVGYYRHFMVQRGEVEKLPRAKKEKPAATETPAKAAKGTKAAPAKAAKGAKSAKAGK